jgi:hypothetical protein
MAQFPILSNKQAKKLISIAQLGFMGVKTGMREDKRQ